MGNSMNIGRSPTLAAGILLSSLLLLVGPLQPQTPAAPESIGPASSDEAAVPRENIWEFLVKGGLTMIGLGLISTAVLAFAAERAFYFRKRRVTTKNVFERIQAALSDGGIDGVRTLSESEDMAIFRVIKTGLASSGNRRDTFERVVETEASIETGNLEKGLNLLINLGNLAPLLGFFGTVTGMRHSFLQFVEKAAPTARDLAGGVEEALITTIVGLLIAMPAHFMYNLFIYYIDSLSIEIERCAVLISSKLKE
jgi:biopolymer transport protein ExbB